MCAFRQNLKKIGKALHEPFYIFLIITTLIFILILIFKANINVFFTTAAAAFFGAGAAFFLNTFHSKKKQRLNNIASLIKAKYCISEILKLNEGINKCIRDKIDKPNSLLFEWEKISAYDSFFFLLNIDVENLVFLLEDKKGGKEVLDNILLVHAESQDIRSILEMRNHDYASYLDRTENRDSIIKDNLKKVIGIRLFERLKQLTERLIETNENLLEDCKKSEEKINIFLKSY